MRMWIIYFTKFDRGGERVEKKKKERAGLVGSLIHTDVTGEKSAPGSVMLTSGYFPPPPLHNTRTGNSGGSIGFTI